MGYIYKIAFCSVMNNKMILFTGKWVKLEIVRHKMPPIFTQLWNLEFFLVIKVKGGLFGERKGDTTKGWQESNDVHDQSTKKYI